VLYSILVLTTAEIDVLHLLHYQRLCISPSLETEP